MAQILAYTLDLSYTCEVFLQFSSALGLERLSRASLCATICMIQRCGIIFSFLSVLGAVFFLPFYL